MDQQRKGGERLSGVEASGAAVARGGALGEGVFARGEYRVECIGPREDCRAEYVRLRDRNARRARFGVVRLWLRERIARDAARMAAMIEPKWVEAFPTLVATGGKNDLLDKYLSGSSYTAAFYLGLVNGPGGSNTYAAGDTMASHAGWTENVAYSQSTRVAPSFSSASAGSKTTSAAAVFSINTNGQTIAGSFLTTVSTKSGTTGVLLSVGNFTGGDKAVNNGDTLNVSYTLSV